MGARRRLDPPVLSIAGPSGVGKTRLILALLPALSARGLRVAALKHTRHKHPLDVRGKDTERFRRAGAVAAALAGPNGVAFFGPPVDGAAGLLRLLPPVDLVLAEGFRAMPLPRLEVHSRSVARHFLAARDPRVFAVVTDSAPPGGLRAFRPDEIERIADLICVRFGLWQRSAGLHGSDPVRSVSAGRSKRTLRQPGARPAGLVGRPARTAQGRRSVPGRSTMPNSSSRRKAGRTTKRSRSEAGRKGGRATLRARGPEFFSRIGRKGGMSRSRAAARGTRRGASSGGRSSKAGSRSRGRGR
ncbi:MAG TPA: molybdopterin-guanine dinucleotide biosynthesis protein B [Anaeromyxobacter sp.]|nr:molybdopterin-guanine dinucleotide biosynthesis protein B [Anaeromyxobacter sp.]